MKRKILSLIVTIIMALVLFYVWIPAINFTNPFFYFYLFVLCGIYILCTTFESIVNSDFKFLKSYVLIPVVASAFGAIILIDFLASPIFRAEDYAKRIVVNEDTNFTSDIKEVDFSKIPLLDKDSSQKLGDRKLGSQSDWVSQYYVSDLYTQINYNNQIVRVTPLEYDGVVKYFTNRNEGIKGYIVVDSVTGDADLKILDKGMKYLPSALFNENLYRHLRFKYKTLIFDEAFFELDNEGNPYFIVPYIKYSAIGLKKEIDGIVILNPVTGECNKYSVKDVPSWVDHVYPANLILEELDNWGEYKNGFVNSVFGQKGVVNTTNGYNYLILDDDVYLYTGVTSVSSDESNLGFVLTNLRTKETKFYAASGAEEYSAISSAEGLVQEKNYKGTFPLLINLNNRPTYLLSLKDNAGLIKMYAFVDVVDYQKVVVSEASLGIDAAATKYLKEVGFNDSSDVLEEEIEIKSIKDVIIDGNTYYYIKDKNDNTYSVNINVNKELLPFIEINDKVYVKYYKNNLNNIVKIDLIN